MNSYPKRVAQQNEGGRESPLFAEEGGLFYCGLFLWISVRIFEQSMITVVLENSLTVFKGLELFALLIVLLHELSTLRDKSFPILRIIVLLALFAVVTFISQRLYLLQLVIIVIVGRNCELRLVLKCALYSTIITSLIIITLSLVSVIPNYLFLWGGRERYGLGFKYATYLPALALSCIVLYGYVYANRLGFLYLIACGAIEIVLFTLTVTRFLCALGIVASVLLFLVTRPRINTMPIMKYVPLLFVVFPLLSYFIAIAYTPENEVLNQLNSLLSSRLRLSHNAIETWGISLFGSAMEENSITWQNGIATLPSKVNVVDSSYISSLISYGVVVTAVVLAGYAFVAFRASRDNDEALLAALLIVSIMGLVEPRLLLLEYNPLIISLGMLFGESHFGAMGALRARNTSDHASECNLISN